MKTNYLLIVIAVLISALIGYGFYAANGGEVNQLLIAFGSGISFAITLSTLLGIGFERSEQTVNVKVVSVIFTILLLISNLIFGFTKVATAAYVIVNGILLLIFILITYGIVKANK